MSDTHLSASFNSYTLGLHKQQTPLVTYITWMLVFTVSAIKFQTSQKIQTLEFHIEESLR